MPANEKNAELEFPLSGIDITAEFQEQKPGTTPEAINVRGYDPIARRARGGSRPGIAHYAPNAVPANTALDMTIQHLAVIVDPHAEALPQNFVTPGDDWIEDPLNPGTFVPPGGWGNPGGARFGGRAILEAIADIEAEGETPSGVTNEQWTITIVFTAGFGDLAVDPGGNIGAVCDDGVQTIQWGSQNYTFQQLNTEAQLLQILKDQSYISAGATIADVFDSVVFTDIGPC